MQRSRILVKIKCETKHLQLSETYLSKFMGVNWDGIETEDNGPKKRIKYVPSMIREVALAKFFHSIKYINSKIEE